MKKITDSDAVTQPAGWNWFPKLSPCPNKKRISNLQSNVIPYHMENHDPRKWQIGRALRFLGYVEEAMEFKVGDVLRPVVRNGCGMGIDVKRDGDGHIDMVWPEEVALIS